MSFNNDNGQVCTLISDPVDDSIQLLLGLIALSSLYAKWHFEQPRRTFQIWFLDAMKQGCSAGMIHFVNIGVSILMADYIPHIQGASQVRVFYYVASLPITVLVMLSILSISISLIVFVLFCQCSN
jgi:hypothetical protein